ncbi:MHYT domain-containing protein [Ruegeria marina]|uniref:MHYT domain-containing protein, NO-binding membrane sensor n=1 Tax=Ruegeria marina TaxID=639004 RepID=A0A1G6UUF2_9RHOB|nr:MHYT domain-containing protein [Ruegeria marina]SDD44998.1 MHYT domain-containing protein, NO-binding membrane sensor [Ruegeria marina]
MPILDYTHNLWLVAASLCVAMIAGFTGLSLTQGLSKRSVNQRKLAISMAAIALGGGIWSMHFVAMLGLQLPIEFYFDATVTLISALVAILVVGVALLLLHFRRRTPATLAGAGIIVGLGIIAMHYIGMAGLQLCRPLYSPGGITLAVLGSCALNIAAFWIAYGRRNHRNILLGTVCFGTAVFVVHFVAIWGTAFVATGTETEVGPMIGKEVLAIGVVLSSFVLCAAFLLTGISFVTPIQAALAPDTDIRQQPAKDMIAPKFARQIPYEQDGRTHFFDAGSVAAIRAEGHYTHIYAQGKRYFCVWSITEAERRLDPATFTKTHRSYLVNPAYVESFERLKDNGICHMNLPGLPRVPVSRARLKAVREVLGV